MRGAAARCTGDEDVFQLALFGILSRISSKLAAMVLLQFHNLKMGRPIGKVKAAVC